MTLNRNDKVEILAVLKMFRKWPLQNVFGNDLAGWLAHYLKLFLI